MDNLVADLITSIPAAFESDEFQAQQNEIEAEYAEREQKPFEDLQVRARKRGIALVRTPSGVAISPMKDGEVMPPEEFSKLSEETQADLTAAVFWQFGVEKRPNFFARMNCPKLTALSDRLAETEPFQATPQGEGLPKGITLG